MSRKEEIMMVKELGELIGYGNMMDIASALWTAKNSKDGIERISHVPAVKPCIKPKEWKQIKESVLLRVEEIQRLGILDN